MPISLPIKVLPVVMLLNPFNFLPFIFTQFIILFLPEEKRGTASLKILKKSIADPRFMYY